MTKIDKDLITNKPSCYIFDIDGCMAEVENILLTKAQTFDLLSEQYAVDIANYDNKLKEYKKELDLYKRGYREMAPKEPSRPSKPQPVSAKEGREIDWTYFKDHLVDANPIQGIVDLFTAVASKYKVIVLTGRFENMRPQTIEWLKKVVIEKGGDDLFRRISFQLIMRSDKELNMPSEKYKRAKVLEISKTYNVQLCIEDCPEIIKEFTDMGILTLSPNREYYRVG